MDISLQKHRPRLYKEIQLEVFLNDEPVAAIACTGNHVDELAVGFLRSEGFIRRLEDIERIQVAGDASSIYIYTGRVSSEIVGKVWNMGIPVMISISVPTSLAVDLAEKTGMSLIGAVRDGRMNIYSHSKRVI